MIDSNLLESTKLKKISIFFYELTNKLWRATDIDPLILSFPQKIIHFGLLFAINHYLYAIFIISLHRLVSIEGFERRK